MLSSTQAAIGLALQKGGSPLPEESKGKDVAIDISQTPLYEKLNCFLSHLYDEEVKENKAGEESQESMPKTDLCNGYTALLYRSEKLGQQDVFFDRLKRIAQWNDETLKEMAKLYSRFQADYRVLEKERHLLLQKKISNCKRDKKRIQEVTSAHYAEITLDATNKSKNKALLALAQDLYIFINSLLFAADQFKFGFAPNEGVNDFLNYADMTRFLTSSKDLSEASSDREVFSFSLNFSDAELLRTLDQCFFPGEQAVISTINTHAGKLKKRSDGRFEFYDCNEPSGLQILTAAEVLPAIKKSLFENFDHPTEPLLMGIKVFSDAKEATLRPTTKAWLSDIVEKREGKFNLEERGVNGATPLYLAAYYGDALMAAALAEYKIDLNVTTDDGATPVYIAAKKGCSSVLEVLHAAGADLNKAMGAFSPAYIAAQEGYVHILKLFRSWGMDLNQAPSSGFTPALGAVQKSHLPVIAYLAEQGYDLPKPICLKGTSVTLAQVAAAKSSKPFIRGLMEIAAKYGFTGMVEELCDRTSLNFGEVTSKKHTPAYYAAQNGHWGITARLLMQFKSKKDLPKNERQFLKSRLKSLEAGAREVLQQISWDRRVPFVASLTGKTSALGQFLGKPSKRRKSRRSKNYQGKTVSRRAFRVVSGI